jgi:uncharacterized protein (DUF1800 family)
MNSRIHLFGLSLLLLLLLTAAFLSAPLLAQTTTPDTVSVILIDGDMREDWPDNGVVGFHRLQTATDLTVNFSITGTAIAGTDYTVPAGDTITIPAGAREAWLEFAPTGQALKPALKTIIVSLASGTGYTATTDKTALAATISIGTPSSLPSDKAAIRFLQQAAFGPDGAFDNVKSVMAEGYTNWINGQYTKPVGLTQPLMSYVNKIHKNQAGFSNFEESWWDRVMGVASLAPGAPAQAADPLRQRVAFALSQIFVISDQLAELDENPISLSSYYDLLLEGTFGNFHDLLYNVGTHPAMGAYLSSLQNDKGDPAAGTFADENYAREVMQLFSIGLWQLNPDGTQQLDSNNQPIPTYDNTTITNMAKVMTGFSYGGPKGKDFWYAPANFTATMRMWDAHHDLTPKTIISGIQLPARTASVPDKGTAGLADYSAAVDALFNHPNAGPFLSKQLIQRLVTSNPSPAYVGRVAAAFANDGKGVRGDMKAVISTILLDPEARNPQMISSPTFGKMKEPYLRTVNLARALNASAGVGVYELWELDDIHFQAPLDAPSVFNFYKPDYSPPGPVNDAGLVAPEFQILNAVTALAIPNYYQNVFYDGFNRWGSSNRKELVLPNITPELADVNDVPAMMRRLDLLLMGGTLSNQQHQIIREAVEQINSTMWQWQKTRVETAIYLIAAAPEYGSLR